MYTCLNSLPELCRTATSVSRSSAQTASPQQTVWGFWGSWGGRNCCYWTWGRLRTGGRGPPSGAGGTGSWWGVRVSGGDRPVYGSGLWSQSSQAMEQIERLVIKANYRDYGESRNYMLISWTKLYSSMKTAQLQFFLTNKRHNISLDRILHFGSWQCLFFKRVVINKAWTKLGSQYGKAVSRWKSRNQLFIQYIHSNWK